MELTESKPLNNLIHKLIGFADEEISVLIDENEDFYVAF